MFRTWHGLTLLVLLAVFKVGRLEGQSISRHCYLRVVSCVYLKFQRPYFWWYLSHHITASIDRDRDTNVLYSVTSLFPRILFCIHLTNQSRTIYTCKKRADFCSHRQQKAKTRLKTLLSIIKLSPYFECPFNLVNGKSPSCQIKSLHWDDKSSSEFGLQSYDTFLWLPISEFTYFHKISRHTSPALNRPRRHHNYLEKQLMTCRIRIGMNMTHMDTNFDSRQCWTPFNSPGMLSHPTPLQGQRENQ